MLYLRAVQKHDDRENIPPGGNVKNTPRSKQASGHMLRSPCDPFGNVPLEIHRHVVNFILNPFNIILFQRKVEDEEQLEEPDKGAIGSVSYTHLDVYKRQM